jgi:plasmid maintenance system antidote protein VapI
MQGHLKLTQWMAAHHKKVIEVCRYIEVYPNQVTRLMNGASVPSLRTAFKIEEMTGGEVKARDFLVSADEAEAERAAGAEMMCEIGFGHLRERLA